MTAGWEQGAGYPPGPGPVTTSGAGRPGGSAIKIGIVLMVLAFLGGGALTVLAFLPLFQGDTRPQPVRGPTVVDGDPGTTFVIYRVGSNVAEVGCTVDGPAGAAVQVRRDVFGGTLEINGVTYRPALTFDLVGEGPHTVSCAGTAADLAVGQEVSVLRTVGFAIAGIGGGIVLFIAGTVVLVIGIVRRSSSARTPYGPGGVPHTPTGPGWG